MTAASTNAALKRKSAKIRVSLDNPNRIYVYTKDSKDSYEKIFNYVQDDVKLSQFAKDEIAVASDCYLLYAITLLGVCDIEGIRLFLSAMAKKNSDLSIADMGDVSGVRKRLRAFVANGMLFKSFFVANTAGEVADAIDGGGDEPTNGNNAPVKKNFVSLYSISTNSQALMNKKLGRRTEVNKWLQAMPLYEMMGWAACAYVAGRLASNQAFIEQIQGVYSTKAVNKVYIPGILKMQSEEFNNIAYVGLVPSFLHMDKSIKTREMFEEDCHFFIKRMHQYFYAMDVKKRLARLVVVVEDNADLVAMCKRIHNEGVLKDDYNRLYFTGEGVLRLSKNTKLENCFLQMVEDKSETGFSYIPVVPDFIHS